MAPRPYHWLFLWEDGRYVVEFGSYDKDDVRFELDDHRDHGVRKKDLLIYTGTTQTKALEMAATLTAKRNAR